MAQTIPAPNDFIASLRQLNRRYRTLLVGIDGRGGSGKSTLARQLETAAVDVTVVEFDDFYRPARKRKARAVSGVTEIGGNFDWRRLREQVLLPLSQDEPATYQRYDWLADELADWHVIPLGGIVVIEGNYSTRQELFDIYDYTAWIDAPHDVRLERGLLRGGEDTRNRWLTEWMPEEERYIRALHPAGRVDLVLDGVADLAFRQGAFVNTGPGEAPDR